MKKGWKIFWIVCISLVLLGIALCISGLVLGATINGIRDVFGIHDRLEDYFWDDYDDREYRERDASGSIEYEVSDKSESSADASTDHDLVSQHAGVGNGALASTFSNIRELDIDVTCLEVMITTGEGSDIVIDTSDITEEMMEDLTCSQKKEELKIELKDRKSWDSWAKNQYKSQGTLLIEIPEGMQFDEVSLLVGAGILYADEIQAKEMDIEVGAGQITLESFTANEMDLECGAGEAYVCGDVTHEAKIECGVGSVTYTASGNQQDYNYELSCGIGELVVGSDSYSGLGREQKINNGQSRSMEIECGIGSVTVLFEG